MDLMVGVCSKCKLHHTAEECESLSLDNWGDKMMSDLADHLATEDTLTAAAKIMLSNRRAYAEAADEWINTAVGRFRVIDLLDHVLKQI